MKKYVVDSSVSLKWLFDEEDSSVARLILQLFVKDQIALFVPTLWEYEIVNALSSAVLRKKIDDKRASRYLKRILSVKLSRVSMLDLLPKVLENSQKFQISGYDSAYVTLASENDMVLISADDKLVQKVNNPKIVDSLSSQEVLLRG